ncbi:hypothetical protein SM12BL3_08310 [Serratia marcescens]|nr:hypothetical protein SM12BL3_08310 [Serratia marcescens]
MKEYGLPTMSEYQDGPLDSGGYRYRYNNFMLVTAMVLWLVFTISPFIAYYLSLIVIALAPEMKNLTRRIFGVLIVLAGTVYIASRNADGSMADDVTNVYYPHYRNIFRGSDYFSTYSGGWEPVLGGLFKLLAISTDELVPKYILMFIFVFLPYLIFYIWLEKFGLEFISRDKKNLCMAASLGVMGLMTLSIQLRQGLSTPMLLLALGYLHNKSRIKSTFFAILAALTHLTAIPIYFILRIFTGENKKHKIIGLVFIGCFVVLFQFFVGAILSGNLLGAASYKFRYYADRESTITLLSFFFALVIMIFAGSFFFDKNENLKGWRSYILWGGAAYIMLLPIPLASERFFMPMSVFLMGYLLFLSFSRVSTIFRLLLILYFIYKFLTVGPFYGVVGIAEGFEFWSSYDWIGDYPFYFWMK